MQGFRVCAQQGTFTIVHRNAILKRQDTARRIDHIGILRHHMMERTFVLRAWRLRQLQPHRHCFAPQIRLAFGPGHVAEVTIATNGYMEHLVAQTHERNNHILNMPMVQAIRYSQDRTKTTQSLLIRNPHHPCICQPSVELTRVQQDQSHHDISLSGCESTQPFFRHNSGTPVHMICRCRRIANIVQACCSFKQTSVRGSQANGLMQTIKELQR